MLSPRRTKLPNVTLTPMARKAQKAFHAPQGKKS